MITQEQDIVSARWWLGDASTRGSRLLQVVQRTRRETRWRRVQDLRHMRLYGGRNYVNAFTQESAPAPERDGERIKLNALKSAVNTAQSYLAFNPRVMFLTDGGTQDDRIAAEKKQDAIDGVFYETGLNQKVATWLLHALIFGTGFLYPYRDIATNTCKIDIPFPFEVCVSDREGAYGEPMCWFRTRHVDRMEAVSKFPNAKKAILDCPHASGDEENDIGYNWDLDQVVVHWAWRRPTPGAPGRHTIILNDGTVLYDKPYHLKKPFYECRWTDPPSGYFGIGMVEEGAGIQTEINYLLQAIQRGLRVSGRSHWLIPQTAKLSASRIGWDWAHVLNYSGMVKPELYVPNIVPPEMYNHLWTLVDRLFSTLGISALAAMMMKPAGINSGKALRTYNDMQSQRAKKFILGRDDALVDLAEAIVDICEDIAENEGGYKVKVVGKDSFRTVDWKEVKGTEHIIRPWPTSQLSQTPTAKLEEVSELIQMGVTRTREEILELLGFPDTKAFAAGILSSRELVKELLEQMVRDGKPWSPLPQMNLIEAKELAMSRYLQAVKEDVPEEKRDLLVEFLDEVQALIEEQNARANAAAAGAGGPAPGGPGGPGLPGIPNPGDGGAGLAGVPNAGPLAA